jgi:hypothetical protein
MDSTLQPMSTSQVLDRTFFLYRKNFVLFAGLGAVLPAITVVMQLGFAAMGFSMQNPQANRDPAKFLVLFFAYFACYSLLYVIGHALATGATVYAVSQVHLGQPVTMTEAYRKVFRRFWTVLGIVVMSFLVMTLVGGVGGAVGAIAGSALMAGIGFMGRSGSIALSILAGLFAVLLFVAGAIPGFYLYLRFSLAVPAAVVEGSKAFNSINRSFSLVAGSVWRVFVIYFLTIVLGFGIGLVFTIPAQVVAVALQGKHFLLAIGIQQLGALIAGILVAPIAPIAISLVYFDQRVRKEAFDLQLMMQAVEQAQPPQPAASAAPVG